MALALCLASVTACPAAQLSPRQACEDTSAALCERYYACLRPDELAGKGLPPTEAACVALVQAQRGCTAMTWENVCMGNAEYNPSQAATCGDQITGLECSQLRNPFFDADTEAPACGRVCEID
jgi:hypothetical protein